MTARNREKSSEPEQEKELEWNAEEEIQLFFALDGLKPCGINKHFFMACICDRLSKALHRDISTEAIWSHLKSMYNLKVLDELEKLPFPNKMEDFQLPDDTEFNSLIMKKNIEIEEQKRNDNKTVASADNNGSSKISKQTQSASTKIPPLAAQTTKEADNKKVASETPKRPPKRTRGSMSLESNSPSSTPPPTNKRRRI